MLETNRMMMISIPKGRERSERRIWFQEETSRPMKKCWIRTLLRTVMLRMVLVDLISSLDPEGVVSAASDLFLNQNSFAYLEW